MGVCERHLAFEHRFGKRRNPDQQRAVGRGQRVHDPGIAMPSLHTNKSRPA